MIHQINKSILLEEFSGNHFQRNSSKYIIGTGAGLLGAGLVYNNMKDDEDLSTVDKVNNHLSQHNQSESDNNWSKYGLGLGAAAYLATAGGKHYNTLKGVNNDSNVTGLANIAKDSYSHIIKPVSKFAFNKGVVPAVSSVYDKVTKPKPVSPYYNQAPSDKYNPPKPKPQGQPGTPMSMNKPSKTRQKPGPKPKAKS